MKCSSEPVGFIVLLLAMVPLGTRCLKLLYLHVPPTVDMFSPVTLVCEFDLEGTHLYSVKWYKDGSEFFRFMPDYDPSIMAVASSGITVDLQKSDMSKVTLINLKFNNSGNYKCEVSTEGPFFETVNQNANMTVVAFPSVDPLIEGVMSTYSIGDHVRAKCTSGKSNPAPTLTWHINGVTPDTWIWDRDGVLVTDSQGLHTKTVSLHFQILSSHFTSNGGGLIPQMEIRCTSTVGDSVRHKAVYPTLVRALTSNKLAQERLKNSQGTLAASSLLFLTTFLLSTWSS